MEIERDMTIEDLVEDYPFAEEFLRIKGIKCIRCGEPIWGTIEDACKEKGFTDEQIDQIIVELNQELDNHKNQNNNEQNDQHTRRIETSRLKRD
jgi:iron-sulfur cluster repair protein YtfE (RIC family)